MKLGIKIFITFAFTNNLCNKFRETIKLIPFNKS